MNELEKELAQLPRRTNVAFGAACAERVLIIYKYTSPGTVVFRGPRIAIDAAWSFAKGEEVDEKHIEYARVEVNRAFPEPDLGGGAAHISCAAAAYALDAIHDNTARAAGTAAAYALDAIDQIDEEGGVEEERAWQNHALQIAKEWGNKPIRKNMFDVLGGDKPSWLLRFES
jgi:hypothetical protein